ncbi:glucan endo-1,3-beta-D-glucosidase ARB_01444-like [Arachis stenosperma]|uniref:glucan endo-1,3-beta-D-glucosidase ARB_01444-like n=1 Tax=Arachis stenosperma TaxID=217475 RepID=UPI0025AD2D4A|nr:glucan endo-1,3-beta-D-glucosidase ARB_01444-like [Arachis stenosperma]
MAFTAEKDEPFLFPSTDDQRDPPKFFSSDLLSSPLPTHSFFQNFVEADGNNPVYIHPYLIKSSASSVSLCYPSSRADYRYIYQVFKADLTISSSTQQTQQGSHSHPHVISSFGDLSFTLDTPSSDLTFFLVRGSPYVTFSASHHTSLISIATVHKFCSFTSNDTFTKYTLKLDNDQTWLLYASLPIKFSYSNDIVAFSKAITSAGNDGGGVPLVVRIALLPNSSSQLEHVLDRYSTCYPVSGDALFTKLYCVEYKWEKRGFGDLLMLAHPLHLQLLSKDEGNITVLEDLKYRSIDGNLVCVVGDSWSLKADHIPVTWHSIRGVNLRFRDEIKSALSKDVAALGSLGITTNEAYYDGRIIAKAARLALIAEEVGFVDVIPAVKEFLHEMIQQWLDGTSDGKGLQYGVKWGRIHIEAHSAGYFLYGIAVLAKIDPAWGMKYKPKAYSLMANFMNLARESNSKYTRLRCFDLYKLHSWTTYLSNHCDDVGMQQNSTSEANHCDDVGIQQDSTSEAVNIYYSAALMGLAYGDIHLASIGSTLASLEIHAAKMWWHVKEGDNLYGDYFAEENKLVGSLLANHRLCKMRNCYTEREIKIGLHVLPLLPITEFLFSNVDFVKDLVKSTPSEYNEGDTWMGFVYALEGIYNNQVALKKIRSLKDFDAGNTMSNLLWWIHSRHDYRKMGSCHEKQCCFCRYSC